MTTMIDSMRHATAPSARHTANPMSRCCRAPARVGDGAARERASARFRSRDGRGRAAGAGVLSGPHVALGDDGAE